MTEQDWRRRASALREAFLEGRPGTGPEGYDDFSDEMKHAYGRWRVTGPVAAYLGFWRDCRFPECRRARACRGLAPPPDRFKSGFPPCVQGDNTRNNAIVSTIGCADKDADLFYRIWPRVTRRTD